MDIDTLVTLAEQKEKGIISEEEFERKKAELLSNYSYEEPIRDKSEWNYYVECITKKYATFKGRARRKEYWSFVLFNMIFGMIFGFVLGVTEFSIGSKLVSQIGQVIWTLIFLLPSYAVSVRRLHDIGYSGWWCFMPLCTFLLCILVLGCMYTIGLDTGLLITIGVSFTILMIVLAIFLFVLTLRMSDLKENKYGPVPDGINY